jgi:hypothetical protein
MLAGTREPAARCHSPPCGVTILILALVPPAPLYTAPVHLAASSPLCRAARSAARPHSATAALVVSDLSFRNWARPTLDGLGRQGHTLQRQHNPMILL